MLQGIFKDRDALERLRFGPAGTHLDEFVAWLLGQGYTDQTIRVYVPASVEFAAWAREAGLAIGEFDQSALDEYRKHLAAAGRWVYRSGRTSTYYSGARRFVAFLREAGVAVKPVPQEPAEVAAFRSWLIQHRGLATLTVEAYVRVALDFIKALGAEPHRYEAASVRVFIFNKSSCHSTSTAKNAVTAVRQYLRFLIATGKCPPCLDDAVPRIADWRLSTLPRYLEPEEVERVIDACEPSTPGRTRDRAVVLLLARLALRARDVAILRLKDIDWEGGRVLVSGKTRRESWLPLPQEVGDALIDYLEQVRPAVDTDAVFLNATAPCRAITSHTVSQIARRAILRSGVEAPSLGAHVFRHSAATALLRRGVPLDEIGAVLRHDSIESTAYYAKVDLDLLKSVARSWPRRSPC